MSSKKILPSIIVLSLTVALVFFFMKNSPPSSNTKNIKNSESAETTGTSALNANSQLIEEQYQKFKNTSFEEFSEDDLFALLLSESIDISLGLSAKFSELYSENPKKAIESAQAMANLALEEGLIKNFLAFSQRISSAEEMSQIEYDLVSQWIQKDEQNCLNSLTDLNTGTNYIGEYTSDLVSIVYSNKGADEFSKFIDWVNTTKEAQLTDSVAASIVKLPVGEHADIKKDFFKTNFSSRLIQGITNTFLMDSHPDTAIADLEWLKTLDHSQCDAMSEMVGGVIGRLSSIAPEKALEVINDTDYLDHFISNGSASDQEQEYNIFLDDVLTNYVSSIMISDPKNALIATEYFHNPKIKEQAIQRIQQSSSETSSETVSY